MHRIFIEKKPAFAAEARHLLHDLRESLALAPLEAVRLLQRYDVGGVSAAEFTDAVSHILSEPQIDIATADLTTGENETAFAVEYLPGQFDQRADSAAQCIQILTGKDKPVVVSARVIDSGVVVPASTWSLASAMRAFATSSARRAATSSPSRPSSVA